MSTNTTTTTEPQAPPRRVITCAFDGSCRGNPGPGGWAAILVNAAGREKTVSGREAHTTNQRMELSAALAGLKALTPGVAEVTMLGDSQYVVKGMTEWMPGWVAKGWKAAGGKPVANRELWEALKVAAAEHEVVRWEWVKGHAGHELNERADRLASAEAARA